MTLPPFAAPSRPRSGGLLSILAWAAVALVVLPLLGIGLAYFDPPGLLAPPPMPLQRIGPLLFRTLALAAVVSASAWALGTWMAWVETRTDFLGRRLLAVLSVLPLAVPSYLVAAMVREEMAPVRFLGRLFGVEGQFTGFWPAALVLTVTCTPYVHLLTAAALRRCPVAEEEAARSMGASTARIFRWVLFPRLRNTWAFSTLLVGLYVVSDFGAVAVLDCEVLTWELYKARGGPDAVILGGVLVTAVLPLLIGVRLLQGGGTTERSVSTRPGERRTLRGAALLATWFGGGALVGIGAVLPFWSLSQWAYSGLLNGVQFAPVWTPGAYTLLYAGFGGMLVLAAAWAPARLGAHIRRSQALENGVYVTGSIPGVLIAVGLLHLLLSLKRVGGHDFIEFWRGLEGAGIILMVAYITRFLAQGYAALKPAVLRIDKSLDESARLLGATSGRRFKCITLPAVAPDAIAAYLIIFMSIAKELPITLLLLPLGETTLAYRIFDGQQEGSLPDVGLAGLVLMGMALTIHLIMERGKGHG